MGLPEPQGVQLLVVRSEEPVVVLGKKALPGKSGISDDDTARGLMILMSTKTAMNKNANKRITTLKPTHVTGI